MDCRRLNGALHDAGAVVLTLGTRIELVMWNIVRLANEQRNYSGCAKRNARVWRRGQYLGETLFRCDPPLGGKQCS